MSERCELIWAGRDPHYAFPNPVDYRFLSTDYRFSLGKRAIVGNCLRRTIWRVESHEIPRELWVFGVPGESPHNLEVVGSNPAPGTGMPISVLRRRQSPPLVATPGAAHPRCEQNNPTPVSPGLNHPATNKRRRGQSHSESLPLFSETNPTIIDRAHDQHAKDA